MNTPLTRAARAGLHRGWLEFRHQMTVRSDLFNNIFYGLWPLAALIWFDLQSNTIDAGGQAWPYIRFVTPGMFAVVLAFGILSPLYYVTNEREDGTLLRARTLPFGLVSYTVGRVVTVSLEALFGLLLVLVPTWLVTDGLAEVSPAAWLHFGAVFVFGLAAILPLGLLIGSVIRSSRGVFGIGMVVVGALTLISGIYFPLQTLPGWLQAVGQALPIYWTGLGMRAALLPDAVAVVEIGASWREVTTFVVLGGWALLGLVLGPLALRRTARGVSGSTVQAHRQAVLQQQP